MDLTVSRPQDERAEDDVQNNLFDSLQAIENADIKRKVTRWINTLLVIAGVQYIAASIYNVYYIDSWLTCEGCSIWTYYNLRGLFGWIYTPIASYLLFRGKRWGWICCFVYDVVIVFLGSMDLGAYLYYLPRQEEPVVLNGPVLQGLILMTLTLLLMAGYIFILWKPVVAAYFNINPRTKRSMLITGICLGLVLFVVAILAARAAR